VTYLVPGGGILGRAGGWTGGEEEREEGGKGPGAEPIAAVVEEEGPHWPSAQEVSVWKLCGRLAPETGTTERERGRERERERESHG